MAYNNDDWKSTELGRVQKNDRGEYIVISSMVNEKTGSEHVDIRTYYTSDEGDIRPTSKGVRFNAELIEEVIGALNKLVEYDVDDEEDYDDEYDGE